MVRSARGLKKTKSSLTNLYTIAQPSQLLVGRDKPSRNLGPGSGSRTVTLWPGKGRGQAAQTLFAARVLSLRRQSKDDLRLPHSKPHNTHLGRQPATAKIRPRYPNYVGSCNLGLTLVGTFQTVSEIGFPETRRSYSPSNKAGSRLGRAQCITRVRSSVRLAEMLDVTSLLLTGTPSPPSRRAA